MTNKFVSLLLLILMLSVDRLYASCGGSFLNPISEVRWNCMMPISLGGVSFADVSMPEAAAAIIADKAAAGATTPVCTCFDPIPRVGLTFGMNIIFRIAEATKDPLCFPSLGIQLDGGGFGMAGQDGGTKNTSQTTFNYTHLLVFAPTELLNLFVDSVCLSLSDGTPFSILYLSEFMPQSKSSELALILAPESLLFANPVAQAYCMVDSVLTVFEQSDPIGYWCVGGHSIFPLSNHSVETEYVDAASINASKMLFTLTRLGQIPTCFGANASCSCLPTPIWNKREFRFQLAKPMISSFCNRMGKPSLIWNTPNLNMPLIKNADNLAFLIWRRRDCCAL